MRPKSIIKIITLLFIMIISNISLFQCQCGISSGTRINPDQIIYSDDNISQSGITWTFDRDYDTGQFANGDWWVIGPVTIIAISPASIENGGRVINGSMLNPSPGDSGLPQENYQGYDSSISYMNYNPDLNVASGVSPASPLVLESGSSLVSTISIDAPDEVPQLRSAAILTVLESAPPAGSFRPPYSGTDKTIEYNVSQLDYSLLHGLAPVTDTPDLAVVEQYFERPWIDHVPGFTARAIHPLENMPEYGREMATNIGIGALMLHLNFTDEQKETLLIRFVQLGIDLYGVLQNGGERNWGADGGHASGRKWPILFAGLMLNDTGMQSIGQRSGDYLYSGTYGAGNLPPDYIHFGEDDQTFYVSADDVTTSNSTSWGPDTRNGTPEPYSAGDIGLADWGISHASDPYQDNKAWSAIYRDCCTAISWSGFVLAARIMGTQTLWNHPALFDYQDRYMAVTAPDSLTPAWRYSVLYYNGESIDSIWGTDPGWRAWDSFSEEMWNTYRSSY